MGMNTLEETNLKVLHPKEGYAVIPNSFAQDHSLSIVTRACLLDTFSRPANWETTVGGLMAINGIGRDNGRRVLREAEASGYAFSRQGRGTGSRFAKVQWFLSPDKELIKAKKRELDLTEPELQGAAHPEPDAPGPGIPGPGKQQQQNKDEQSKDLNKIKKKDIRHSPSAPDVRMDFSVQGETASDYPADFEEWWNLYPRKVGKGEAAKLWSKLSSVQKKRAMTGLRTQLQDLIRKTRDQRGNFCPHPQTWLRQSRFDDVSATPAAPTAAATTNPRLIRDPNLPEAIWINRIKDYLFLKQITPDEARACGVAV